MSETILQVNNLNVSLTDNKEISILNGLDLSINPGEIHAIMGPNGSGKSTLANTIAGNPMYQIDSGDILMDNKSVIEMSPDERAKNGIFLSFQYPTAIPGVTMVNMLRASLKAIRGEEPSAREFIEELKETLNRLKMDESFARRYVNDGFSGGEKKRAEILQLGMIKPKLAILDETDSGLDVDALRAVADGINTLKTSEMSILMITHYERILNYVKPDFVHILVDGKIVKSGGFELAKEIEEQGYDPILSS
ncbi:MAG: Fe-S cluster assembly ATPase SufC [Dehalococcoidia bacterium]